MIEKNQLEIHWIAGLLEGEGCFRLHKKFQTPMIYIGMTDRDTIEKARAILGGNSAIHERPGLKDTHKRIYSFAVTPSRLAIEWMHILYPLMSERRKKRIKEIIAIYDAKPRRADDLTCAHGHVFAEVGYYIQENGSRTCKTCAREHGKVNQQALRDRRKAEGIKYVPPKQTLEYALAQLHGISIEEAKIKLAEIQKNKVQ